MSISRMVYVDDSGTVDQGLIVYSLDRGCSRALARRLAHPP
ncbi:hypothetical protein [Demequina litorisediminis]|nr:hypothetical protein [Demequina litorisediminis]